MRKLANPIVFFLVAMVLGCATVPPAPETRREAVLVAEYEYMAVLRTASDLRRDGAINDEFYGKLSGLFREASTTLNLAHLAAGAGDDATLDAELASLRALVLEVRRLLLEAGQ